MNQTQIDERGTASPDESLSPSFASGRRHSVIWHSLEQGSARFYRLLSLSHIGRLMTSYRRGASGLFPGEGAAASGRCRPLPRWRCRMVQAAERSLVLRGGRALSGVLADCPVNLYSLFFMLYAFIGILIQALVPQLRRDDSLNVGRLIFCAILLIVSIPLALSSRSLVGVLGGSRLFRWLFADYLGIPGERLDRPVRRTPAYVPYLVALLAIPAAFSMLWIHPAVIPLCLVAVGMIGMILSYPEAGVVLTTAFLPFLWLSTWGLYAVSVLVLMTWIGYVTKILLLHRTFCMGRLDGAVAACCLMLICTGGSTVSHPVGTVWGGVLPVVLLSEYFLIVNLMNTRAGIRRCMVGVGVTVVVLTFLGYARLIPTDAMDWMSGSRAGDVIRSGFVHVSSAFVGWWESGPAGFEMVLTVLFPWLLVFLLSCRRLKTIVSGLFVLGLNLLLVYMEGSYLGLICILSCTLLFFLLYSHRSLAAIILLIPGLVCGVMWYTYFRPLTDVLTGIGDAVSSHMRARTEVWTHMWNMVEHAPGTASRSMTGNMSTFLAVLMLLLMFLTGVMACCLYVQKSISCLHRTGESHDRAVLSGGLCTVAGLLFLRVYRNHEMSLALLFTVCLVIALCSAYASVLFDEESVLMAPVVGDTLTEDRIFRM